MMARKNVTEAELGSLMESIFSMSETVADVADRLSGMRVELGTLTDLRSRAVCLSAAARDCITLSIKLSALADNDEIRKQIAAIQAA
jgi:hypothetical protein